MIDKIKLNSNGSEKEFRLNECESLALEQAKQTVKEKWSLTPSMTSGFRLNEDSAGFSQMIDTLAAVETEVAREKNMEQPVEEAIDIVRGVGAWKNQVIWYESHMNGGDSLDAWRLDYAQEGASKGLTTASVTQKSSPLQLLGKMNSYTRSELEQSYASGVWDAIREKAMARAREYELRFQEWAFKGTKDGAFEGLLTLSGVTTDTDTTLTARFCDMTDAQFQSATSTLFSKFYINSDRTAKANRLIMPAIDFMNCSGMYSQIGSGFSGGISRLERLKKAFIDATKDPNADIISCNYADAGVSGQTANQYVLYKKDRFELKIDMPVPFGIYPGVSVDGWNFQDTAVAQVSGVIAKYKKQIQYFKVSV